MDLDLIVNMATRMNNATVAVAVAEDTEVLEAVSIAVEKKLAKFILFGDSEQIHLLLRKHAPRLLENTDIYIKNVSSPVEACSLAVKAVKNHEATVLMKGNVATSTILKEVLNKDYGLRAGKVLSHVAVFEVPNYDRFFLLTDAAMNIAPTLEQKEQIVQNAVQLAQSIGIEYPKVAALAAVEVLNPSMQATIDAAALKEKNRNGEISGCIIEGPLALDIAVSKEAAKHKKVENEVAGSADILLVPNIETGNALYKSMIYFANAQVGAMIAGAAAPIVLTSRSDSAKSKLYSLALAICSTKI
ncbi:phosphate butyryltransferase [Bacillus sp. FJAT-49736]|uniref:phosphate butyryltransferase n=1 Tax=Bacillus sp. FJAT-49736 TaxID=2833582 RepID=UPI001BC9EC8F|nr:phosphate butyryltransferase [Bacillus sp. FJAT-49736]MBS4173405.1 phosphate butyryltransferase [Bacillus sp. FJAT-49736]